MGKVTREAVKYMLENYQGKVLTCKAYEKQLRLLHCFTTYFEEEVEVQFGSVKGVRAVKIIGKYETPHGFKWEPKQ